MKLVNRVILLVDGVLLCVAGIIEGFGEYVMV